MIMKSYKIPGSPLIDSHFSILDQAKGGLSSIKLEWRVPIGCDFSGFFVEFLGYLVELVSASASHIVCKEVCLECS